MIANALISRGHKAALLELYGGAPDCKNFDEFYAKHGKQSYKYQVPEQEPDLNAIRQEHGGRTNPIGENVLEICRTADTVFLALHGSIGENGQLQAVFDTHGITYTGTGYAGSLLAMDKLVSKELMRYGGILTPDWEVLGPGCETVPAGIGFPCVVKPVGCGSSVGISIVEDQKEWDKALEYAGKYEDGIFVEKKIKGREFSVGVLAGEALPVIEIIPKSGFFDYKNKYQNGLTDEICPADIGADLESRLREAALAVHKALRLGSYSRIDFMVGGDGKPYCLEANTLPGMTPASLLPKEAAAAGISFSQFCERIAGESVKGK